MDQNIKFEDKMNRLDEIVSLLEKNEVSMEEALKLFEEGLNIAKYCEEQLKYFENKANELINEYEQNA